MFDVAMAKKAADTVRVLSAEAIQKAKSGHPGMPLGCADYAITLWSKYLRHNPANPEWFGRDRFILSAGHGSMLIYSLLHLFNYGLEMEELKNFRQWGSLTPGHPEFGHTRGVGQRFRLGRRHGDRQAPFRRGHRTGQERFLRSQGFRHQRRRLHDGRLHQRSGFARRAPETR